MCALWAAIVSWIRIGAALWSMPAEWPSLATNVVKPTLLMRPALIVSLTCSDPYWSDTGEPTTVLAAAGFRVCFGFVVVVLVAAAVVAPVDAAGFADAPAFAG